MSPELSQLIELQELDFEMQRVSDRLARIPSERDQIENEFEQYAAEFLDLKSKHDQTVKDREQLEAELATVQQHHEKFKQDLMRVTNPKQYETALREIDATKKHASALETDILRLMEETEKLEADINERAPDTERKRAEVDQNLAAIGREHEEAERKLVEMGQQRNQLVERMPGNLYTAYDRMSRSRRGQVLAEISGDGVCTACRMKVRPKVFSDVRKGDQLITCEYCGRILFYRAEQSQSGEAALS